MPHTKVPQNPSGVFTNIAMTNLLGAYSRAVPTPVHVECWESSGGRANGWIRVEGAKRFVEFTSPKQWDGMWVESLSQGAICWFCKGVL